MSVSEVLSPAQLLNVFTEPLRGSRRKHAWALQKQRATVRSSLSAVWPLTSNINCPFL